MAKNWTAAEATQVIREGTDLESIKDIGGRYPLFAIMAAGNDVGKFALGIPASVSARIMNGVFLSGVQESGDDEDETEKPPAKKNKPGAGRPRKDTKKDEDESEDGDWGDDEDEAEDDESEVPDFKGMDNEALKAACKKYKFAPVKGMKKADVVKALEKAFKESSKPAEKKPAKKDDDDDWDI